MSNESRNGMFSAILLHSGSERAHLLRYLVATADCIEVARDYDNLTTDHELKRVVGVVDPEVVLVDLCAIEALGAAAAIRDVAPTTVIIGFGPSVETALMASRVVFDVVLAADCTPEDMRTTIQDCLRKNKGGLEKTLYCFLPSKAGSGSSTIAMNTAAALARDEGKRVLVLDADLRSGVMGIMLGTEPKHSLQSVLGAISHLDKRRLPEFVYSSQGVDYLLSSRSLDAAPPDWRDYFHLIAMVRSSYDVILVDLPELVNPATIEFVSRAKRVFVVCTPEVPSMTLAKHRCTELARLQIPKTRTGVLVNRWSKLDPSPNEINGLVEHEITKVFPNDYPAVRSAILAGRPVDPRSRLGMTYTEFAGELFGKMTVNGTGLTGKLKSLWGIRETVQT